MTDALPILISILALVVSIASTWLTLFRRGHVKMTRPTVVAFVQDSEERTPKVFLRALLYCTAHRGRVVETMFATLRRGNVTTTFAFWGYGESTNLTRGSGLFVGQEGVALNHHFVLLDKTSDFTYSAGSYQIEVFATLVGDRRIFKLTDINVMIPSEEASKSLNDRTGGLMFNWNPETEKYVSETRDAPGSPQD